MPTRSLPARPDLQHLKHQASDLVSDRRAGHASAYQRLREFHPRFSGASDGDIGSAPFTLADAYLTIAREYGFPSWARLRAHLAQPDRPRLDLPHHERITDPLFRRAVDLLDDGDIEGLEAHLRSHPAVVRQRVRFDGGNYFREPTLLEFIAENPVRHGSLPPNIEAVARTILDAGARSDRLAIDSALQLVASGSVPRESGVQVALIDLLCDYRGDPGSAMLAALGEGEFEAIEALIRRGAQAGLVAAAATGRSDTARAALAGADAQERHRALALAAQHGHARIVDMLLDAGESPDRYNPVGCHAHSTPLHQAALAGHTEVVRLLVERGARLDMRDIQYHGTARDWAVHAGRDEVALLLDAAAGDVGQGG